MLSPFKSTLTKSVLVLLVTGLLAAHRVGYSLPARAASGMPDSPEFGYGARLDIWGQEVELALKAAAGVGVEWIGIDFDWSRHWSNPADPVDLEHLDQIMSLARGQGLHVLLSITNPPGWAKSAAGPDQNQTAGLVVMLAKRYPESLLAIELFPHANTFMGWGASPDPQAYAAVLKACQTALQAAGTTTLPVAGGLSPSPAGGSGGDMDDLAFVMGLYQAGAADYMPILGLRLGENPSNAGEPLANQAGPAFSSLRRYEDIRQIMLQFNHQTGLIWITGFELPGEEEAQGPGAPEPGAQIRWLNQAYQLMKSQLYIGVAFIDRLNPPEASLSSALPVQSLITAGDQGLTIQPALAAIGQIISLNRSGHTSFQLFLPKKLTTGEAKRSLKPRGP